MTQHPHRKYLKPPQGDLAIYRSALSSKDWQTAKNELLGLALHHDSWRMVQDACLSVLDHESIDLRTVAVISLGHIARIHRELDRSVLVALEERIHDREIGPLVEDILDWITFYLGR
jgi:hypothetical protein